MKRTVSCVVPACEVQKCGNSTKVALYSSLHAWNKGSKAVYGSFCNGIRLFTRRYAFPPNLHHQAAVKSAQLLFFTTDTRVTHQKGEWRERKNSSGSFGGPPRPASRGYDKARVTETRVSEGSKMLQRGASNALLRDVYRLLESGQFKSALERLEHWFSEISPRWASTRPSARHQRRQWDHTRWFARDAVLLLIRLYARFGDMESIRKVLLKALSFSSPRGEVSSNDGEDAIGQTSERSSSSSRRTHGAVPRTLASSQSAPSHSSRESIPMPHHSTPLDDGGRTPLEVEEESFSWLEGIDVFNAYLEVLTIRKFFDPKEIQWVLAIMKERGVSPNLLTFNYLIEIHIRAGYDPTGLWYDYLQRSLLGGGGAAAASAAVPSFAPLTESALSNRSSPPPIPDTVSSSETHFWYFAQSSTSCFSLDCPSLSSLISSYPSSSQSFRSPCLSVFNGSSLSGANNGGFLAAPLRVLPFPATLQALLVRVVPFVHFAGNHRNGAGSSAGEESSDHACSWLHTQLVVDVTKASVLGSSHAYGVGELYGGAEGGSESSPSMRKNSIGSEMKYTSRTTAVPAASFLDKKQLVELIEQWLLLSSSSGGSVGSNGSAATGADSGTNKDGSSGFHTSAGGGTSPAFTTSARAIVYPPEYVMWLFLELELRCVVDHDGSFVQYIQKRHLVALLLHCAKCGDAITLRQVLALMDRHLVRKTADTGALAVWGFSQALWIESALEMILWMEAKGYLEYSSSSPFFQRYTTVDTLRYTMDRHFLMTFVDALSMPELVERALRFLYTIRDGERSPTPTPSSHADGGWTLFDTSLAARPEAEAASQATRRPVPAMNGDDAIERDESAPSMEAGGGGASSKGWETAVASHDVPTPSESGAEEKRWDGVCISPHVLDLIVLAWCKVGREREAIRLVESYETEWGVTPRTNTLNVLLMGLQWSWARRRSMSSAATASGGGGGWDSNASSGGAGGGGGVQYHHDIFVAFTQNRPDPVIPNALTYKLLIRQAVLCDEIDEAVGYLQEVVSDKNEGGGGTASGGVRVEVEMILPILERAARAGDADTANLLSQFALDCDIGIDPAVLQTAIGHLTHAGQAVDILRGHLTLHEALRLRSKVARQRAKASIRLM